METFDRVAFVRQLRRLLERFLRVVLAVEAKGRRLFIDDGVDLDGARPNAGKRLHDLLGPIQAQVGALVGMLQEKLRAIAVVGIDD